jgi:TPR repeat protein
MRTLATLLFGLLLTIAAFGTATAAPSVRQGVAAMERQDYAKAAAILSPLAQNGNPEAQASMGYLYEIGRGVPQDFTQAAIWYRRAAEQGLSWAQFQLGMLYDLGHGVPVDVVEAEKWLILATAASPPSGAEDRTRMRDAVLTKMTRGELAEARMRALAWRPKREQ